MIGITHGLKALGSTRNKSKEPLNVTVTPTAKDAASSDSEPDSDGLEKSVLMAPEMTVCHAESVKPKPGRKSGRESLLWLSDDFPSTQELEFQPICRLPVEQRQTVLTKRITVVATHTCDGLDGSFGEIVDQVDLLDVLQFIAEQRMRAMPHQGSRLDLILRWAASFARSINDNSVLFSQSIDGLKQYASYVYGATKLLIEVAVLSDSATRCVYSIMSMLEQMATTLDYFGRQLYHLDNNHAIIEHVALCCADLLEFCASVSVRAKAWGAKASVTMLFTLEAQLSVHVETFYQRKQQLILQIWQQSLERHEETITITVKQLQLWLDIKVKRSATTHFGRCLHKSHRHEQSYEWFYETLRSFCSGSEDVLLVTGQAASGKSALMAYILEQLQCPKAGLGNCDVVKYDLDGSTKNPATVLSMLKTWARQLLEIDVGNAKLYQSLVAAHTAETKKQQLQAAATALWKAIEAAVDHLTRPVVFLVDSLDRCVDAQVFAKIQTLAARTKNCQFIISSRSGAFETNLTSRCRHVDIEVHNHVDIRRYFELELRRLEYTEEHIYELIRECHTLKIESFLQAQLFVQIIRRQKSIEAIRSILVKLRGHYHEHIDLCCEMIDFKNEHTRIVFQVLLGAKRALSVAEFVQLLKVNVKSRSLDSQDVDLETVVTTRCGGLVTIRRGFVCFTHERVGEYLLSLCRNDKLPFTLHDAHHLLAMRSLIYLKISLGSLSTQPSFDCKLDDAFVASLIHKHILFEYAMQTWIFHYRYSAMYESDECSADFKAVFPGHVHLAILEGMQWHACHHNDEAAEFYRLAWELRLRVFGNKHVSIVQCLINMCHSDIRHGHHSHAYRHLVEVWELSVQVCGKTSAVAVAVAECYVELIMKLEVTERHQHLRQCGSMYKFLWHHYKHSHSEHHELSLYYAQCLAEVHVALEEHEHALTVLREIRTITTKHHGHFHMCSVKITQLLLTVLSKTSHHEECFEVCEGAIKASEDELDCWHADRLRMTLRMVEMYEHEHHHEKAERLLIQLRLQLIEACKKHTDEHIHEAKIEITLQLARFLRRCKREDEAQKLLLELWAEYEKPIRGHHAHGHGLLLKIKLVGECMKEWGFFSAAKHVFVSLCGWFKKSGKTKEVVDVSIGLSHCHHHCNDKRSQETVLVELWETLLETCTTTTVDVTVITTTIELVTFYEHEHRWTEARDVCVKVLHKIWVEFATGRKCGLPQHHREETIRLVVQLGRVHVHLGAVREAISVHLALFKACKLSLALDHCHVLDTAGYLATCYEEHHMIEEAVDVWIRLRDECRSFLGHKHERTIHVLYKLAHLCQRHGQPGVEQYLLDIAVAFGFGEHACHPLAIEAVLTLCKLYQKQRRDVSTMRKCYYSLWLTFKTRGLGCGIDHAIVLDIFHRYVEILQSECEHDEVVQWVCEYRKACVRHFGQRHWVSVKIAMEVAVILAQHEHRHQEAIDLYEGLCKHETEVQVSVLMEIKRKLALLYCRHEKHHAKAEVLLFACWRHAVETYGHAHEHSCGFMVQHIDILIRLGQREKAKQHLHTVIIAIFESTVIETQRLHACAHLIATQYLKLDCVQVLIDFVRQIRIQLCSGTHIKPKHGGLVLEGGIVRADLLLFLYMLEVSCDGQFYAYDECWSLVLEEKMLWEVWLSVHTHPGCEMGVVLAAGVGLLHFLHLHGRAHDADGVLTAMWAVFCATLSITHTAKSGAAWDLFTLYISTPIADGCLADFLGASVDIIIYLYTARSFSLCLSLSQWLHQHVAERCGGWASPALQAHGLRLAFCLAGRTHTSILCLDRRIRTFGQTLFDCVLQAKLRDPHAAHLHACSAAELETMLVLLGERRAFAQLETLLAYLWETRVQSRLEASVVLGIAYRLVEVRCSTGKHRAAAALAEDVVYNLRRVYGPADAVTLRFTALLAAVHEACGEHGKAAAAHRQVLSVCIEGDVEGDVARVAKRAVVACGRLGCDEEMEELVRKARALFEDEGECKDVVTHTLSTTTTSTTVTTTETTTKTTSSAQVFGCWQAPKTWGLVDFAV